MSYVGQNTYGPDLRIGDYLTENVHQKDGSCASINHGQENSKDDTWLEHLTTTSSLFRSNHRGIVLLASATILDTCYEKIIQERRHIY